MLGRLNGRAKAQRKTTMGPPGGKTITPKLKGGKMLLGKLKRESTITPDCLLNQTSLLSNYSKENMPPMMPTKQRLSRFSISFPALKKKRVQEKHGVQGNHGHLGSSGFLNLFRKKKEILDSSDSNECQESSTGDRSVLLEKEGSYGQEMKNEPLVQHELEEDQDWLTQEPELDDVPFLDRITVFFPIEDEYESPIAANEIETTFPYTIYDDLLLRSAYSEESIFNNNKSGAQFLQGTHPTRSRSDSFDGGMAGARVLLNIQRPGSDPLDFPFKSPARESHTLLLRGSLSSDDLARYDSTAVMENMDSSQWSTDFDSSSHDHTGGFAMAKSRCCRSDPSLTSERSNKNTADMTMVEVHCRSDPSLGEHWGTAPSSRTPFRASPSFECMLVDAKQTNTIIKEEIKPAQNSRNIDGSDSTIHKETTPARISINIDDSGYHQLSKTSRSRSDPSAVANTAFLTSRCTPTQPASTVDVKRTRSAAMEKTNCLPQDGGVTVRTSKNGDLALPEDVKDRFSRLVSSAVYDDDQNVVRVFSTLLSLDHMCPVDAIDAIGSEVGLSADVETHSPMQSLKLDPSGSEVSASLSRAQSIELDASGSTVTASRSLSPTQSLKLDASGRGSASSASRSHTQSLTLYASGSAEDGNHSHAQDLKVHNDGLKVESFRRDSSLDNKTDVNIYKDPSTVVNIISESCPKTESTSYGLLPLPSSEDFSALTGASMSSEDGLYLLTSVDVLEVDTNPTPVANGCLALAANDISIVARCEVESRRLVSKPTSCEYSACSLTVGDETATTGRYASKDGTLTEASSRTFSPYGCLHPLSDVLPLYVDFFNSMMD